jgi:hypothetical protein
MNTPEFSPRHCCNMFKVPQSSHDTTASCPPILDHVTICFNDSAASSSSALDKDLKGEPVSTAAQKTTKVADSPRSIFKHYWAKNSDPDLSSFKHGSASQTPSRAPTNSTDGQTLCKSEVKSKKEQQQHERRIFSRQSLGSQSWPLLSTAAETLGDAITETAAFPRNKSTSALNNNCKAATTTARSCLLPECRYSGGAKTSPRRALSDSERTIFSSSSSTVEQRSVDFSTEVKVLVYQEPQECYAADGWSNYFA